MHCWMDKILYLQSSDADRYLHQSIGLPQFGGRKILLSIMGWMVGWCTREWTAVLSMYGIHYLLDCTLYPPATGTKHALNLCHD
jgi:hypothetical protein